MFTAPDAHSTYDETEKQKQHKKTRKKHYFPRKTEDGPFEDGVRLPTWRG